MKYKLLKSTIECFDEKATEELNKTVFGSGEKNAARFVEEYLLENGIEDYVIVITGGMYKYALENKDGVLCLQKPIHASSAHVEPDSEMNAVVDFVIEFNNLIRSKMEDKMADELEDEMYKSILSLIEDTSSPYDEKKRLIKYLESLDFYSETIERFINTDFIKMVSPLAAKNRIYLEWNKE